LIISSTGRPKTQAILFFLSSSSRFIMWISQYRFLTAFSLQNVATFPPCQNWDPSPSSIYVATILASSIHIQTPTKQTKPGETK
jgi:hypothetical protein